MVKLALKNMMDRVEYEVDNSGNVWDFLKQTHADGHTAPPPIARLSIAFQTIFSIEEKERTFASLDLYEGDAATVILDKTPFLYFQDEETGEFLKLRFKVPDLPVFTVIHAQVKEVVGKDVDLFVGDQDLSQFDWVEFSKLQNDGRNYPSYLCIVKPAAAAEKADTAQTAALQETTSGDASGAGGEEAFELGARYLGKVTDAQAWYEGTLKWVRKGEPKCLFYFDRSALGPIEYLDGKSPTMWLDSANVVALDAELDSSETVFKHQKREVTLKKVNKEYEFSKRSTGSGYAYSSGGYMSTLVEPGRAKCGFAGLKNQGATCYLNSLVQSYFMTPRLREAIYRFRYDATKREDKSRCVPFQLQKLFGNLELCSKRSTDTEGLTTAFGWGAEEAFEQQDVCELATLLLSNLEERSKDENIINTVSEYKVCCADYVKCMTCDNRNERTTEMNVVALPIEGHNSLDSALSAFIKPETLEGDNAYMCSVCDSKQPAKKGIRFTKFNDFVSFQLNRWTLDFTTFERKKLNNKIRFPFVVNMAPYLVDVDEDAEDLVSQAPKYEVAWTVTITDIKDPEPLLDDFRFAASSAAQVEMDNFSLSVLDTHEVTDDHWVLKCSVIAQETENIVALVEDHELFFTSFLRALHSHTQERDITLSEDVTLTNIGTPTVAEKKEEYELYGMMIHRGGAYGGHYFAYIKHPTEHRFYEFNDEEVDEIQPEELGQMFDEEGNGNSRRASPLSGAYMLLYGRVGADHAVPSPDLLPDDVKNAIIAANKKYDEKVEAKKKRDNQLNLEVHHDGQKKRVELQKTDKVNDALSKVRLSFEIPEELDEEEYRLRVIDRNQPRTPLSGEDKTLLDWNINYNHVKLFLEKKDEEGNFEFYEPSVRTFTVKLVNMESEKFVISDEVNVDVAKRGNIGSLRAAVADILGTEMQHVKLWKHFHNASFPIALDDDTKGLKNTVSGTAVTIIVETCEDYDDSTATFKTYEHYREQSFQSEINLLPGVFGGGEMKITFDNRMKLGDFRKKMAEKFEIDDPYAFCIEKAIMGYNSAKWMEQTKDQNTLRQMNWVSNYKTQTIRLVNRPALKPGELKLKIKVEKWIQVEDGHRKQVMTFFPDFQHDPAIKMDTNMDYDTAREWFANLTAKNGGQICDDPERIRIRKCFTGNQGPQAYCMDNSMQLKDMKLFPNNWIYLQILDQKETLTNTMRVVNIARWYPSKRQCSGTMEIVVDGNMKVKDGSVARFLAEKFESIPAEHIRFQKTNQYYIKKGLCSNLDWDLVDVPANATLLRTPVLMKHNDSFVFKDNRDPETGITSRVSRRSITRFRQRRERGLKIHTFDDDEEGKENEEGEQEEDLAGKEEEEDLVGKEEVDGSDDGEDKKEDYEVGQNVVETLHIQEDYVQAPDMGGENAQVD